MEVSVGFAFESAMELMHPHGNLPLSIHLDVLFSPLHCQVISMSLLPWVNKCSFEWRMERAETSYQSSVRWRGQNTRILATDHTPKAWSLSNVCVLPNFLKFFVSSDHADIALVVNNCRKTRRMGIQEELQSWGKKVNHPKEPVSVRTSSVGDKRKESDASQTWPMEEGENRNSSQSIAMTSTSTI